MTMPFIEYSEIFDNENIGDVGMLFFKAIGHLSGNSPRYYERDAITLIKDDTLLYRAKSSFITIST